MYYLCEDDKQRNIHLIFETQHKLSQISLYYLFDPLHEIQHILIFRT